MSDKNLDEQFAEIIAHWDEEAAGADPLDDDPAEGGGDGAREEVRRGEDVAPPQAPGAAPRTGWRVFEGTDAEDHFEPPPPQPLPSGEDKHFWGIIMGLVGGPLMLLFLVVFDRAGSGWWKLLALVVTVTGFVLLVLRQPTPGDDDDDGVRL